MHWKCKMEISMDIKGDYKRMFFTPFMFMYFTIAKHMRILSILNNNLEPVAIITSICLHCNVKMRFFMRVVFATM